MLDPLVFSHLSKFIPVLPSGVPIHEPIPSGCSTGKFVKYSIVVNDVIKTINRIKKNFKVLV